MLGLRPRDRGAPHEPYFLALQEALQREGHARPLLIVDRERLARNCARLVRGLPRGRAFRIVAKSLPSLGLLREVMRHTGSSRLMTFHQPFMNVLAAAEPGCDLLLGKPMPLNAMIRFYRDLDRGRGFSPELQVQWLIDTLPRLEQYLAFATRAGEKLRVSVEIDVGLRRGGLRHPRDLDPLLELIREHPRHLELSGLMGYDAHVGKTPRVIERAEDALERANDVYRSFIERIRCRHADLYRDDLVFNGAGSPTIFSHGDDTPLSELSAGSCLLKPTDFDLPSLAELKPAAFIAAPVLKVLEGLTLPGPVPLGSMISAWDPNRRRTIFIYGGKWMADPVSPRGLSANPLYGSSSNQMMFNGSPAQRLAVDDWVFLRPTQSEAVLLQFGELLAIGEGAHAWWPPLGAEPG
jgi:D-serine deaminase-like pyridoxal phosphate-dependent protein